MVINENRYSKSLSSNSLLSMYQERLRTSRSYFFLCTLNAKELM